jgi:ABC-type multidrug transport system ATPase subunit
MKQTEFSAALSQQRTYLAAFPQSEVAAVLLHAQDDWDTETYKEACRQLARLDGLGDTYQTRLAQLARIEHAAPVLAHAISQRHGGHGTTQPLDDPTAAWRWRQWHEELERRASVSIAALQERLNATQDELRSLAAQIIEHETWAAQRERTVLQSQQALMGYVQTIRKVGKGTGKRVPELLRQARQLLTSARGANRVRREVEWLHRGPKARTRKSGARIQGAVQLQQELAAVTSRAATRAVGIEFNASDRRTKRILVAEQIAKRFGTRRLLEGLSLTLSPGMHLGVLGANGCGKTTLLRLLAGEIAADHGTIERADGLRTVYLDQNREHIDDSLTLRRALAPHGDQVVYADRPLHVATWARRFLFPSEQLDQPVSRLSGGERARVAIARLMLRPANVLILDEPRNDLDIPTLEVLEESLLEFPGALVLVTHDRFLFDRVSTMVLALDGNGGAQAYADYQQWEDAQRESPSAAEKASPAAPKKPGPTGVKRLSYSERREWEQMESMILDTEQALEACHRATHDPSIAADALVLQQRYEALRSAQEQVDRLYARWAELEEKQALCGSPGAGG